MERHSYDCTSANSWLNVDVVLTLPDVFFFHEDSGDDDCQHRQSESADGRLRTPVP